MATKTNANICTYCGANLKVLAKEVVEVLKMRGIEISEECFYGICKDDNGNYEIYIDTAGTSATIKKASVKELMQRIRREEQDAIVKEIEERERKREEEEYHRHHIPHDKYRDLRK